MRRSSLDGLAGTAADSARGIFDGTLADRGERPRRGNSAWLEKWKNAVVISQEVGCGLVPVEPEQRRFREAVGRLNCLLAESAETVERVCCGLGMRLK